MPLNTAGLQSDLLSLFSSPAPSTAACAQQWANALVSYASAVVPPSLTVSAAGAALASSLTGAFAAPAAAPLMELAFATFAATVGAGMLPAFVAAPPPRPVGFAAQFLAPAPTTHAEAAANFTSLIDGWMRSATSTPAVGGSPTPWL